MQTRARLAVSAFIMPKLLLMIASKVGKVGAATQVAQRLRRPACDCGITARQASCDRHGALLCSHLHQHPNCAGPCDNGETALTPLLGLCPNLVRLDVSTGMLQARQCNSQGQVRACINTSQL